MQAVFVRVAGQPSVARGDPASAQSVCGSLPHTQTCAHTHSTLHRAAEKPFAGGGFNSLRSLLPGISCNVWSLKPNPSSKQLCECQHQEVF